MVSSGTIGVCAGVAGALFVGYCIYFDKQRRSHPDFKKKLRDRRRKQKKPMPAHNWPNLQDQEEVHKFFLSQVQTGEELLASGDMENGVEYLSRAVAVCGQPQQLLQVLQQTLPVQVFQLLISKLPDTGRSMLKATKMSADDVE